jgi:hemerythrin-like domain-containing protein
MGDEGTRPASEGSPLEGILDEHRECMQIVAEVEACLDEAPDREGRWLGRLLPKLETLAGTLRSHFRGEEEASLYREVPERFPRFADTLQRLLAEHADILARAQDLVRRAGALDHTRIHELREFNAGAQMLVASIRRHEAEENEVVLNAHWQEVGEGD